MRPFADSPLSPVSPLPPIEVLDAPAFDALVASGRVLEASRKLGPKVIALPEGRYLKLLRVKGRFSTWGLLNPARRFARNAVGLSARDVPTLAVDGLYHLPHLGCWAVSYRGLAGTSIRQLLKEQCFTEPQQESLMRFIRELHDKGIYFRGLHPGNILLLPDGRFGLIDILDCHFRHRLWGFQRQRNLRHFFRYKEVHPMEKLLRARYARLS